MWTKNTNKTISNQINTKNENVIKGNNSNYSPNLVKSFSYVKKYNNLDDTAKTVAMLKITDENIRNIVRAM